MTLEEWEQIRFWIILIGGACTVGAMIISAYITTQKPGVQSKI